MAPVKGASRRCIEGAEPENNTFRPGEESLRTIPENITTLDFNVRCAYQVTLCYIHEGEQTEMNEVIKPLEVTLTLEARIINYSPERPAPHAQCHDSTAFSDPGDPEEIEFSLALLDSKEHNGGAALQEIIMQIFREAHREVLDGMREVFKDRCENFLNIVEK